MKETNIFLPGMGAAIKKMEQIGTLPALQCLLPALLSFNRFQGWTGWYCITGKKKEEPVGMANSRDCLTIMKPLKRNHAFKAEISAAFCDVMSRY